MERLRRQRLVEGVNEWAKDRSHLELIQEICRNLLGQVESSVTKCKALLLEKRVFINIFDYVSKDFSAVVRSKSALRGRCLKIGYYPRQQAKSEGLSDLLAYLRLD